MRWTIAAMLAVLLLALPVRAQQAIAFDPLSFDKFAGFYQMAPALMPNTVATVTRGADHYFLQLTRQPTREIFPLSTTSFFAGGLPLKVTFQMAAGGTVTGLVIQQGGQDVPAQRIDEVAARAIEALPPAQVKGHIMPRTWQMMAGITPRMLTSLVPGNLDYWPSFSPDGQTVLFSRSVDGGKNWLLMWVAAAGGNAELFAKAPPPVSATRADWSKTGRIAFTGTAPDGSSRVWITEPNGTSPHPLATSGVSGQLFYPSWYPDGKSLAVIDAGTSSLKRLDIAGGAAVSLTDPARVLSGMASVSPDATAIVFAGQQNAGQPYNQNENVLWLRTADSLAMLEAIPFQGRAPVWSPDGRRIAFESNRGDGNGRYAIFLINRDGSGLIQVTDYALNASHPVWSHDGRKMAFATGDPARKASAIAAIDLADGRGG